MYCKWLLVNAVFLCFFGFIYTTNDCNNCTRVTNFTCLQITTPTPSSVIYRFTLKVCRPGLVLCEALSGDDCCKNPDISDMNTTAQSLQCQWEMGTTELSLECSCENGYCVGWIIQKFRACVEKIPTPENCNCSRPMSTRTISSTPSSTTDLGTLSTPTGPSVITSTSTSPFSPMTVVSDNSHQMEKGPDKNQTIGIVVGVVGGLILIIILIIVAVIILRRRRTKPSSLTVLTTRNTMLPNSSTVNGNLYSDPIVVAPYESLNATSTQPPPPPPPTYATLMTNGVRGETEPSAPNYDYDNAAGRSDEEIRHMNEVRAEGSSSNYNYDNIQTNYQQPTTGSDETILIENNLYRH